MNMLLLRRKDRALDPELSLSILQEGEYGVLATTSPERGPLATPLNYVCLDGRIYFHAAREGHKMENLAQDPRVCFCIVGPTKVLPNSLSMAYVSVIILGRASLVEGDEKKLALEALVRRFGGALPEGGADCVGDEASDTAVIRIDIESLQGKGAHLDELPMTQRSEQSQSAAEMGQGIL
jgi:nitroimidazol reductase NimA-like FMN-containing flavoprotein (pyridoxamine 5'-phosphate oxidase superfamily)